MTRFFLSALLSTFLVGGGSFGFGATAAAATTEAVLSSESESELYPPKRSMFVDSLSLVFIRS